MSEQKIPKAYGMLLSYIRSTTNFMSYYYIYKSNAIKKSNLHNLCSHFVSGAVFDSAVISWCRLLGNEKTNPTHWKNIFSYSILSQGCNLLGISNVSAFKEVFLSKAGINEVDFKTLHKEMLFHRNKYTAHHDVSQLEEGMDLDEMKTLALGINLKAPDLNLAKESVLGLYSLLGEISVELMINDYMILNHFVPLNVFDKVMKKIPFS